MKENPAYNPALDPPTVPYDRTLRACRKGHLSFDEGGKASKARAQDGAEVVIRGDRDACADNRKGRRAERDGDSTNAGGYGRVPEVQRRAGQGGGGARGRPPSPELGGQARSVRRQEAHSHRRTVHGEQRAGGRVLALAGALNRRGTRVAQAGTL